MPKEATVTKPKKNKAQETKPDPRPEIIDTFKEHRLAEKHHKKESDKIKPDVLKILKVSTYKDVYLQKSKSISICEEEAVQWARENLNNDQYKSLFIKVFDPNKFHDLMAKEVIDRDSLPDGIVVETEKEAIYVKE